MYRRAIFKAFAAVLAAPKKHQTMSGFSNPIIGGGGSLVYPSIHSPNFSEGSAGWSIDKDGDAEFNDVTIRGNVIVTDSSGGFFLYDGAPAAGNLLYASTNATSDPDSLNTTIPGAFRYLQISPALFAAVGFPTNSLSPDLAYFTATSPSGPWTLQAQIFVTPATGVMTLTGTQVAVDTADGLAVTSGPFTSTQGNEASPSLITTDTWHSLGPPTVTDFTFTVANYRLEADGWVSLDIRGSTSAGVTDGIADFTVTLPAALRPVTAISTVGGFILNSFAWAEISTGGVVAFHWPTTGAAGSFAIVGRFYPS